MKGKDIRESIDGLGKGRFDYKSTLRMMNLEEDTGGGNDGGGADPFDGPVMTKALIERVLALPFDKMSKDQFEELIDKLKVKQVPEDLEADAKNMIDEVMRTQVRVVGTSVRRVRQKLAPLAQRLAARREARKHKSKHKLMAKKYRRKAGFRKLMRVRKQKSGQISRLAKKESVLGAELRGLLNESVGNQDRFDIAERIERIFDLIDYMFLDEAVAEVLADAAMGLHEAVDGSDDEFQAKLQPALKLLKRMCQEIENKAAQGNA